MARCCRRPRCLNATVGEDKTLSIKLGTESRQALEDVIVLRGISTDVNRVPVEIRKVVEDAKNDETMSSYAVDFNIDSEYVGRILDSGRTRVNELRVTLGVKVEFSDEDEAKEKTAPRRRSPPTSIPCKTASGHDPFLGTAPCGQARSRSKI